MLTDEQITDPMVIARMNDIMQAVLTTMNSAIGLTNLTEGMKSELISGVTEIKDYVCGKAYKYYCDNEFEVTDENKPLLIEVAESAAKNGLL